MYKFSSHCARLTGVAFLSLTLVACGGGSKDDNTSCLNGG